MINQFATGLWASHKLGKHGIGIDKEAGQEGEADLPRHRRGRSRIAPHCHLSLHHSRSIGYSREG